MAYSESRLLEYRAFEIGALRAYFKPGLRVLEIGGGNGWQARQIQQWGCATSSIDIGANEWREQHFPVMPFERMEQMTFFSTMSCTRSSGIGTLCTSGC